MKYLSAAPFSVNGTGRVMAGTCERCIWGRGKHAEGCDEWSPPPNPALLAARDRYLQVFKPKDASPGPVPSEHQPL